MCVIIFFEIFGFFVGGEVVIEVLNVVVKEVGVDRSWMGFFLFIMEDFVFVLSNLEV